MYLNLGDVRLVTFMSPVDGGGLRQCGGEDY